MAIQEKEGRIHGDLQKARSESGEDDTAASKDNSTIIKGSNKKSAKKSHKNTKATNSHYIKDLEGQLLTLAEALATARANLDHFSNFSRGVLQGEYNKIALTINDDSPRYIELEQTMNFLFDNDNRLTYFREMIPIVKKVGAKQSGTVIVSLPYLIKFQCKDAHSPIVTSLIEEMYQLYLTEELRLRLKDQISADGSKLRLLRQAEEALGQRTDASTELIRKHYRKKSIKLHPDRNGESFRPVFEEFTDARDVLSDVKLRQRYLREMLQVIGLAPIEKSQESWVAKHRPDKAMSDVKRRDDANKKDGPPQLEGGLFYQMLKGPMIQQHQDGKKSTVVSVSVHVPHPIYEFYSKVRSIRVVFSSTHGESQTIELKRGDIAKGIPVTEQGASLRSSLCVGERVLSQGIWDVAWFAKLDSVGT